LRLEYTAVAKLLSNFISKLETDVIYVEILPTQKTARWSYFNPAPNNFPRRCINPDCPTLLHEKTDQCWSLRDCIKPYADEYWIDGDHDAFEARIFALILGWQEALDAFEEGYDPHTPTACGLFDLPLPQDKINPHVSSVDESWRHLVEWQGKDDKRRTLAKNFTYGSQYVYVEEYGHEKLRFNPNYILSVSGVEEVATSLFGKTTDVKSHLVRLAKRYIELNHKTQLKKARMMASIKKQRKAYTLHKARRIFFESTEETAKEGFNHRVQGTGADYMNESILSVKKHYPQCSLVQNSHDGLKIAFPNDVPKEEALDAGS